MLVTTLHFHVAYKRIMKRDKDEILVTTLHFHVAYKV